MNLVEFIQLLMRHKIQVLVYPLVAAVLIYAFTRRSPDTYSTEAIVYTGIASGYNIDNDKNKVDYNIVNSKFDNLINLITAEQTEKEVTLRIMAYYINRPKEFEGMMANTHSDLLLDIYKTGYFKKYATSNDTLTKLKLYDTINSGKLSTIYNLMFGKKANPFSLKTYADLKADRIAFSDMIKIDFDAQDPALCKRTVDVLCDVVFDTYKDMKVGEVDDMVKYFMAETAIAKANLEKAENNLRNFRTENKVLNYYEQSKYIAVQQDDMDNKETDLLMKIKGYQSSLAKIESKLSAQAQRELKSQEIVNTQNSLSKLFGQASVQQASGAGADKTDSAIASLKIKLNKDLAALYSLNNTTEGISNKTLLDDWLTVTVNLAESNAALESLRQQKDVFSNVFTRFAPMGSDLNKLERDEDVAEKEYLNLLNSLDQAELREKNLRDNENVKAISPAELPIVPNPSKRLVMVIAGFMAVLIFVIVRLVLKDYLDDTISNPSRISKLTGIDTATAYVDMDSGKKVFYDVLNDMSNKRWLLSYKNDELSAGKPINSLLLLPFTPNVNADEIAANIKTTLSTVGINAVIKPATAYAEPNAKDTVTVYTDNTGQMELLNANLLQSLDKMYIVFDAHKKLNKYQLEQLNRWKKYHTSISIIIVNTYLHHIEAFLGEVPKNRSKIRVFIKKLMRLK